MSRRYKLPLITATLAIVPLLFLPASATQEDLSFSTPAGTSLTLSSLKGRVVVLVFSGIQDPQCKDEFKALQSLGERYRDKPLTIFWVSINTESQASNDLLKSPCGPSGSVQVLRDSDQAAFKRLVTGAPQLPTVVILDRQGAVHRQPRGGFNPDSDFINDLAAEIDAVLGTKATIVTRQGSSKFGGVLRPTVVTPAAQRRDTALVVSAVAARS